MQFKPELIELIMQGRKRQTRRPKKDNERPVKGFRGLGLLAGMDIRAGEILSVVSHGADGKVRTKYDALNGQIVSIQPGRGKPAVAKIKILRLRLERFDDITEDDAIEEGFTSRYDFLNYVHGLYPSKKDLGLCWAIRFRLVQQGE